MLLEGEIMFEAEATEDEETDTIYLMSGGEIIRMEVPDDEDDTAQ